MATLRDGRIELVAILQQISGIKSAPEKLPESEDAFPFVAVHAHRGEFIQAPNRVLTGLHDYMLEIHVQRMDIGADYDAVETLLQDVAYRMNQKLNAGAFAAIQTWQRITYFVTQSNWGGDDTLAAVLIFEETKVMQGIDE